MNLAPSIDTVQNFERRIIAITVRHRIATDFLHHLCHDLLTFLVDLVNFLRKTLVLKSQLVQSQ